MQINECLISRCYAEVILDCLSLVSFCGLKSDDVTERLINTLTCTRIQAVLSLMQKKFYRVYSCSRNLIHRQLMWLEIRWYPTCHE